MADDQKIHVNGDQVSMHVDMYQFLLNATAHMQSGDMMLQCVDTSGERSGFYKLMRERGHWEELMDEDTGLMWRCVDELQVFIDGFKNNATEVSMESLLAAIDDANVFIHALKREGFGDGEKQATQCKDTLVEFSMWLDFAEPYNFFQDLVRPIERKATTNRDE